MLILRRLSNGNSGSRVKESMKHFKCNIRFRTNKKKFIVVFSKLKKLDGGQHLERPKTLKFRNLSYQNNKSRIIQFFYFQICFIFLRSVEFFEHLKYMYDNLRNWKFLVLLLFYKFLNFENLLIFEIEQFQKFNYFMNSSTMRISWFYNWENW